MKSNESEISFVFVNVKHGKPRLGVSVSGPGNSTTAPSEDILKKLISLVKQECKN